MNGAPKQWNNAFYVPQIKNLKITLKSILD